MMPSGNFTELGGLILVPHSDNLSGRLDEGADDVHNCVEPCNDVGFADEALPLERQVIRVAWTDADTVNHGGLSFERFETMHTTPRDGSAFAGQSVEALKRPMPRQQRQVVADCA